jgi:hypothetical protein
MLYKKLLKLKEDTQSLTNLKATHWYLCLLEGIPTLHVQVLQRVFAKFEDSYTLLDVYNIFEKLKLAHAHYHVQGLNLHQLHQPNHHIFLQGLKRCTRLHPSYLLETTMAILPVMPVHGLIHDGRSWACPSCLLRLMYVLR